MTYRAPPDELRKRTRLVIVNRIEAAPQIATSFMAWRFLNMVVVGDINRPVRRGFRRAVAHVYLTEGIRRQGGGG